MVDPVAFLAAHCGAPAAISAAGLTAMFLFGASGSVAHCGVMCGPLVAGQVAERLAALPADRLCEQHRLRAGLLLPYHAGRLTTYAALGAAAGGIGFAAVSQAAFLRGALLLAAAGLLIVCALGRTRQAGRLSLPWLAPWARRLDRTRATGTYLFGLVMGLLPCGLLYAALIGAAALATPLRGAAGMLAFGAGTIPMLAVLGIAGQFRPWRAAFARAAPWLMVANAAVLVFVAMRGMLA